MTRSERPAEWVLRDPVRVPDLAVGGDEWLDRGWLDLVPHVALPSFSGDRQAYSDVVDAYRRLAQVRRMSGGAPDRVDAPHQAPVVRRLRDRDGEEGQELLNGQDLRLWAQGDTSVDVWGGWWLVAAAGTPEPSPAVKQVAGRAVFAEDWPDGWEVQWGWGPGASVGTDARHLLTVRFVWGDHGLVEFPEGQFSVGWQSRTGRERFLADRVVRRPAAIAPTFESADGEARHDFWVASPGGALSSAADREDIRRQAERHVRWAAALRGDLTAARAKRRGEWVR